MGMGLLLQLCMAFVLQISFYLSLPGLTAQSPETSQSVL